MLKIKIILISPNNAPNKRFTQPKPEKSAILVNTFANKTTPITTNIKVMANAIISRYSESEENFSRIKSAVKPENLIDKYTPNSKEISEANSTNKPFHNPLISPYRRITAKIRSKKFILD